MSLLSSTLLLLSLYVLYICTTLYLVSSYHCHHCLYTCFIIPIVLKAHKHSLRHSSPPLHHLQPLLSSSTSTILHTHTFLQPTNINYEPAGGYSFEDDSADPGLQGKAPLNQQGAPIDHNAPASNAPPEQPSYTHPYATYLYNEMKKEGVYGERVNMLVFFDHYVQSSSCCSKV